MIWTTCYKNLIIKKKIVNENPVLILSCIERARSKCAHTAIAVYVSQNRGPKYPEVRNRLSVVKWAYKKLATR